MKKNVASQKIGAQMVSASDGSAFTGAVTVYVTLDAGTQAIGSVGSGACTHEGNGYHTYAPAQAETNGDLVAFTFIGTGAVPGTVQVFTSFPQTGDSFALIGATGSGLTSLATQASVNTIDDLLDTEVAAIKADTAAILIDTAEIGVAGAGLTTLASASNLAVVAGYLDTEVAAIKAKTDNLPASPAAVGSAMTLSTAGYEAAADALLNRNVSGGSNTGRLVKQAYHFIRNKWVVAAGTLTVYDTDDTTSSWTASVTGTAGADPVTGSDPA